MLDGSNVFEIRPAADLSPADGSGREWPAKGLGQRKRCQSARQVAMATAKKEADCRKAFRCSPPCRCGAGSMIVQDVA